MGGELVFYLMFAALIGYLAGYVRGQMEGAAWGRERPPSRPGFLSIEDFAAEREAMQRITFGQPRDARGRFTKAS